MKHSIFPFVVLLAACHTAEGPPSSDDPEETESTGFFEGSTTEDSSSEGSTSEESTSEESTTSGSESEESEESGLATTDGEEANPTDDSGGGFCGWDPEGPYYECGFLGEDPEGNFPIACPEGLVNGDPCSNSGLTGEGCCDANGNNWYCEEGVAVYSPCI